jgi:hypothetical protein
LAAGSSWPAYSSAALVIWLNLGAWMIACSASRSDEYWPGVGSVPTLAAAVVAKIAAVANPSASAARAFR